MSALAKQHNAINLSQGFPDYDIDPILKDLVNHYVQKGMNQYAPMTGIPILRQRISEKIKTTYDIYTHPDEEITITNGATEALYSAISAFIHPGDEVILFEPAYDSYIPAIEVNGGCPVPIPLFAPDYTIPWSEVARKINGRTRMIIINTPHNPTGSIWSQSDIESLETLTQNTDIIILSDEVYQHLTYDDTVHHSVLKRPSLRKRSIVAMSFGKTFHVTGWRIGYCVAPPQLTLEIRKVHQFNTFTINTPLQYALADYLAESSRYLSLSSFFQAKRDLFINAVRASQFELLPCQGTYFILASFKNISTISDTDFARWMTTQQGVAVIPISVFYSDGTDENIIRFCFAKKNETLLRAAELIRNIESQ